MTPWLIILVKMKNLIYLCLVLMIGLVVQGCDLLNENKPIVIGAIYNLTGSQAALDAPSSQGAHLAVALANAEGGILARTVQLALEDGMTDEEIVETKTASIIKQYSNVSALFGFSDTDMVLPAAQLAAENGLMFVTSGATSPQLPDDVPEYLFLACFGDNVQAAAAAEWAFNTLEAKTVSVLFNDSTSYTQLLQGYFRTRFEELGGEVLSVESYIPGDDLDEPIEKLAQADLIYLAAQTGDDVINGILALREAGFTVPILGGDGYDVPSMWANNPEVKDVYFTTHAYLGEDNENPNVIAFREAYAEAYDGNEPDAFVALGYDTANLIMAAISKAGRTNPGAVLEAMSELEDFEGVTGTISFVDGSRIPTKTVSIVGVADGGVSLMAEVMPESVPAP
jgi:branched-chain amino acid transport system substrate-binding protein